MQTNYFLALITCTSFLSATAWSDGMKGFPSEGELLFMTTSSPTTTTLKAFKDTTAGEKMNSERRNHEKYIAPVLRQRSEIKYNLDQIIRGREAILLKEISQSNGELLDQVIRLLDCDAELFKQRLRVKIDLLSFSKTSQVVIENGKLKTPQKYWEYLSELNKVYDQWYSKNDKTLLEQQRLENLAMEYDRLFDFNEKFRNKKTGEIFISRDPRLSSVHDRLLNLKDIETETNDLATRIIILNNHSLGENPVICDELKNKSKAIDKDLKECGIKLMSFGPALCKHYLTIYNFN